MIHYVKGNLLDSSCDYICHQVNCQGTMGAGLAKQVKDLWPEVYESYCKKFKKTIDDVKPTRSMLGDIQVITTSDTAQKVVNLFAQDGYGRKGRYTSYDAFWECLNRLKEETKPEETIAFPYLIGCGLGGANWEVIHAMIDEVFKFRQIYIYYLSNFDLLKEDRKRIGL